MGAVSATPLKLFCGTKAEREILLGRSFCNPLESPCGTRELPLGVQCLQLTPLAPPPAVSVGSLKFFFGGAMLTNGQKRTEFPACVAFSCLRVSIARQWNPRIQGGITRRRSCRLAQTRQSTGAFKWSPGMAQAPGARFSPTPFPRQLCPGGCPHRPS